MRRILFSIGSLHVYGYGLMIAVGIIFAFAVSERVAKRRGLDPDALFNMGVAGVISGLLGAKLLFIIVELPAIIRDPSILLNVSQGFVVYGGLVTGLLAGWLYAKKKNLPIWRNLDCGVVGIAIGQGFGRLGCFLAGCCYGKETACRIHVVFPADSLAPAGIPLIPTQLISSAGNFLLAFLVFLIGERCARTGRPKPGSAMAAWLILYAAGRFVIEFFRADERGSVGVLSTSQFIACLMAAVGVCLLLIPAKARAGRPGRE